MTKISLLLADVDGTLVTQDKVLTERTIESVRQLGAAGIKFAVTSGRPPRGMSMLIEPLALSTPLAAFNGGLLVRSDLSIIESRSLTRDIVEPAVKIIEEHGLSVWIYRGNDWFVTQRHGSHVDREEWTVKFPPTVVENFDAVLDDVVKIVGVSDDLAAVKRCEDDMGRELAGLIASKRSTPGREAVAPARAPDAPVSAARSQPYYLDVTHPQANKGGVVDTLSAMFNIPGSEIATIGDMPNDVLMFVRSGLSIAMGNASAEVQTKATYVTSSNQEEGFANAVEKFILGL